MSSPCKDQSCWTTVTGRPTSCNEKGRTRGSPYEKKNCKTWSLVSERISFCDQKSQHGRANMAGLKQSFQIDDDNIDPKKPSPQLLKGAENQSLLWLLGDGMNLGGGNSNIFTRAWRDDPIWRAYFSDWLVQRCFHTKDPQPLTQTTT